MHELDATLVEEIREHAMGNGGPELGLDVVSHDRDALRLKAPGEFRIADDEDGNAVHERNARVQCALGIEASGLLGADGEVVHEHLGTRLAQRQDDLFAGCLSVIRGKEGARVLIARHVVGHSVKDAAHPHQDSCLGEVATKYCCAVRGLEDGLGDVLPHLAHVDVEGRHDFDVARPVATDLPVHEPDSLLRLLVPVVLEPLDQRAGAVPDSHDSDLDRLHGSLLMCGKTPERGKVM